VELSSDVDTKLSDLLNQLGIEPVVPVVIVIYFNYRLNIGALVIY